MGNFEVLQSIPSDYKKKMIGAGAYGKCYRTKNGDVYKEFMGKYNYEKDIDILSQIQSPFFAFPKKIVYLEQKRPENIKGYLMDYVDGINFEYIDGNTGVNTIITSALNLEREIFAISRECSISLFDLHNNNVLFRPDNTFKIIDTDLYEYVPYKDVFANIRDNMKEWNEYLLYNLECTFESFKSRELNLHFEIAMHTGKYKATDIISEVIEEIRKEAATDVVTLNDYYEGLKLVKKKEYI